MNWKEGTKEKRDSILAAYPDRTFGRVQVNRSLDFVHEGGTYEWNGTVVDVKDLGWTLSMAHQYDDVEIGGAEDAQKLISDLQGAIQYCAGFDELKDRK